MKDYRWKLTCLQCGQVGYDLVAMQEHLMEWHEVTREMLVKQERYALAGDTYRWSYLGRQLLFAEKESL